RYRAWWSNNSFNSVMTKAWLAAGFESAHVNMKERKLVFRQIAPKGPRIPNAGASSGVGGSRTSKHHPLIGWMKGTVGISPGVDLPEPADPEWGERAWGGAKRGGRPVLARHWCDGLDGKRGADVGASVGRDASCS